MPLMDGYQFIRRVKEIKPHVKVFFMSAFLIDDIQFRTGLSLVKVDEYIEKPISINQFISLVRKYFTATETSKY
jgi:response regulator RpfG family c-di-GMP phosphodiesterase